jgi:hypothetical protein
MAVKKTHWPLNLTTSFIAIRAKIYPILEFWFENIPSGNPGPGQGYQTSYPAINVNKEGSQLCANFLTQVSY